MTHTCQKPAGYRQVFRPIIKSWTRNASLFFLRILKNNNYIFTHHIFEDLLVLVLHTMNEYCDMDKY